MIEAMIFQQIAVHMYIAIVGAILTIIKIVTGPTIAIDMRNKLIDGSVMKQGIQQLLVNMVNMSSVLDVVIMATKPNIVHLSNVLAMKGVPNQ